MFSHSANAVWMSFVLSSFGKPLKERMRVTAAERPEVEAEDMDSRDYMDAEEKDGMLVNIETNGGLKKCRRFAEPKRGGEHKKKDDSRRQNIT